jgi:hypothetical protein
VLVLVAAYAALLSLAYCLSLSPRYRAESAWFVLGLLGLILLLAECAWTQRAPRIARSFSLRTTALASAALVALSCGVYASALSLGLLSDDFPLVQRAVKGEFVVGGAFFRPVPLALWMLLRKVSTAPWLLHALNLLLHGVNAALLLSLCRALALAPAASATAAVLFVCFPASVEAVAWTTGIQDVLLTTGSLVFVLACGPTFGQASGVLAGTTGLLVALGTKETAVVAPILAILLYWRSGIRWRPRLAFVGLVAVAVYAALRLSMGSVEAGFFGLPPGIS